MSSIRSFAKRVYLKTIKFIWFFDALLYLGSNFSCPICTWNFRKMKPFKEFFYIKGELIDHYTDNAICPRCGSDIRHRFSFNFLKDNTKIFISRIKLLHFAPETYLSAYLRKQSNIEYVCCDIDPAQFPGSIKVNITNIQFFDASFDAIICIHVLEHIQNDIKAIGELYRILRPGGWALIAIPVYGDTTFELYDLDYDGRETMYGTGEHMRMNGLDFTDKLTAAGFSVSVVSFDDVLGNYMDRNIVTPHTESDKYLFFCKKLDAETSLV